MPRLDGPLTDIEKRFIQRSGQANAPITFMAHHIWICRALEIEPDMHDLDHIRQDISDFRLMGDRVT